MISNSNWDLILRADQDINTIYTNFLKVLHNSIELHVPLMKPSRKPKIPKYIKKLAELKRKVYQLTKIDSIWKITYKNIDSLYKQKVYNYNKYLEERVLNSKNKKQFYGFINRKLKTQTFLPPMIDNNKCLITDPLEKANLINNYFSSVFTKDDNQTPILRYPEDHEAITTMPPVTITPSVVNRSIKHLKNSVSHSPDGIPSYFLRNVAQSVCHPLSTIFNLSLQKQEVPDLWRTANVKPIHKNKGLRNDPKNLRPISLTSPICRTIEDIFRNDITTHLNFNRIISPNQHGFIKFRSTVTQQLVMMEELTVNYENKTPTHIIYLDFAKAFDSIPHRKLIFILNHLKIDRTVIGWITKLLHKRTQRTMVNNFLSDSCEISSGVPQGSVLAPTIFSIIINDLLLEIQTQSNLKPLAFADDLKLVSTRPVVLQQALNAVNTWAKQWQLKIQPTKSEYIEIKPLHSNNHSTYTFSIDGQQIPQVNVVKDLGLFLSQDLKWTSQISNTYLKAIRLVWLVIRSFKSNNLSIYISIFKTYIRPLTEYNCNIWNPYKISDVTKIESIQKTYTRLVCQKLNIRYNNYSHRLDMLNLETLEKRRLQSDIILAYKIQNNIIDVETKIRFTASNIGDKYGLRRHNQHFKLPTMSKSTIRSNFFRYKIVKIWNKLPQNLVSSKTLTEFKTKLKSTDLSLYTDLVF